MNGTRRRLDSDDEQDEQQQEQKRSLLRQPPPNVEPAHYDIYAIPSLEPPSPLLRTPLHHFQSASFVVVNRAAGLQSGLGARFGLASPPDQPQVLLAVADPGFFLPREQSYDPSKAVLLGWVEEERLGYFEQVVRGVQIPALEVPPRGGEMLEWLLTVAQRLEYEGICANGELLLEDILQLREGYTMQ